MKSKEAYLNECALNYGEHNFRVLLVNGDTDAIMDCALEAMELYAGQSRWISVDEELPPFGTYYLACYPDGGINMIYTSLSHSTLTKQEFISKHKFTHWQPLPALPTPPTP